MAATGPGQSPGAHSLSMSTNETFTKPQKMINDSNDVDFFLKSKAYTDIVTFLLQLNAAMFPRATTGDTGEEQDIPNEGADSLLGSPPIAALSSILAKLEDFLQQAPPDPGPRRFGNVSFRKWYNLLEEHVDELLDTHLPEAITSRQNWSNQSTSPKLELKAYLLGSFGSAQRLDYGTGHELSFLAFLASMWKLGGFTSLPVLRAERAIVLCIIRPYLDLVRRLIKTYNLEPAGSHGVWGLDDHSFLPYVFGSAQLSPPIKNVDSIPAEGSSADAPDPGDVTKIDVVDRLRDQNLYFGAIGFIYDVKKGPFWEHSPTLYDISGVKAGWAKINKGMVKMYIGEVLSKFPVVQHFPFGNLFKWEHDPSAPPISSTESSSKPSTAANMSRSPLVGTAAPWGSNAPPSMGPGSQTGRPPAAYARTVPPLRTPTSSRQNASGPLARPQNR